MKKHLKTIALLIGTFVLAWGLSVGVSHALTVLSIPQGGTNTGSIPAGIVKSNGTTLLTATSGTDYVAPTGSGAGLSGIVTTFNTRTGAVTLGSSDVTTALGFTPYNATNPSNYIAYATALTTNSVPFANSSAKLAQDNNNLYFQDNSVTPTILAANTNTAFSIDTGGDFTGTDSLNLYAQGDAYLPNSLIVNTVTGLATDGETPGWTTSSSRGTGGSPIELQSGDLAGMFSGWGAEGASSPTYANLGGVAIIASGAFTNNLGGELDFYTKADGGLLTKQAFITNAGVLNIGVSGTKTGAITFNGATSTGITVQGQSIGSSSTLTLPTGTGNIQAKRVLSLSANSATPAINTNLYNVVDITGQTAAITSFTTNLTGTPNDGDTLEIAITGTTSIGITWGASFESSSIVTLSTSTSGTNRLDMYFIWDSQTSKWRQVGVS